MKNPQFLLFCPEIKARLPTHETVILTKFHKNGAKIVDFLSVTYFRAWVIFFVTVSIPDTFLGHQRLHPVKIVIALKFLMIAKDRT